MLDHPFRFITRNKDVLKKILRVLFIVEILLSGSEIFYMSTHDIGAAITGNHVKYLFKYPPVYVIDTDIVYGLVTIVPCFISSIKGIWLLGFCFTASLLVSAFFLSGTFIICLVFFAVLLSILINTIIDSHQKIEKFLHDLYKRS